MYIVCVVHEKTCAQHTSISTSRLPNLNNGGFSPINAECTRALQSGKDWLPTCVATANVRLRNWVSVDLSVRFFGIFRPYVVVSMRMRYMCAFRFYRSSAKGRERERRARESVHRRRLCDQESARLQRPPRKGRPARHRVRDRAI